MNIHSNYFFYQLNNLQNEFPHLMNYVQRKSFIIEFDMKDKNIKNQVICKLLFKDVIYKYFLKFFYYIRIQFSYATKLIRIYLFQFI